MGLSPQMEGEEGDAIESLVNGDRVEIGLPPVQAEYLRLLKVNGCKIVLVLTGGSAIALGDIADLADAIVYVWYPGQEGGRAVADVLFGNVSPSGKLPVSFPKALEELPPFEDYNMQGRTYRYAEVEPQFPFGFGLGYSRFTYDRIEALASIAAGDSLPLTVTLTNAGSVDSEEVVQVYVSPAAPAPGDPLYTLAGFRRVAMPAGATQTVSFTLSPDELATFGEDGAAAMRPGAYRVIAGGSSPGERSVALGAPAPVEAQFTIR
jgi:beta-glucosidase